MIKSITPFNPSGESLKIELGKPEESGFLVRSIDGLGPVKATINTTKIAMTDGARYNSSYLDQRSIVINLMFLDSAEKSIEDMRHESYRYFPINKEIRLVIETDTRTVETTGIVEDNQVEIFSQQEGAAITILCSDPLLYSVADNRYTFSGIEPLFEFPFQNESVDEPELVFGMVERKETGVLHYAGDYDVGFTLTIHATGAATNPVIRNLSTKEYMRIDTDKLAKLTNSEGLLSGDTITIETRHKRKSITLLRDGKYINILNCLDKGCKWLTIRKGDNVFNCTADANATNLQFYIKNKVVYEGV